MGGAEDRVGIRMVTDGSHLPWKGGPEPPALSTSHGVGVRVGEQSNACALCLARGWGLLTVGGLELEEAQCSWHPESPSPGTIGSEWGGGHRGAARGGAAWETWSGPSERCSTRQPGRSSRKVQVHRSLRKSGL